MSEWIKASMGGDQGSCVEVMLREADVDVRPAARHRKLRQPFTAPPKNDLEHLAPVE